MTRGLWRVPVLIGLFVLGCATAGTYPLLLRYGPGQAVPSLRPKFGSTVGFAAFKDRRPETLYIGIHAPATGMASHFKSEPFPLEKALQEALAEGLSRRGVKPVPASDWNRSPESLKSLETDSILTLEIHRFWIEGTSSLIKTNVKTVVQLVIFLGIKQEEKVCTKRIEMEREMTVVSLTPEKAQEIANQLLADVLDAYLSNPC